MLQTKVSKFTANVGEEIGLELGAQMISSYRQVNTTDTVGYFVGRNILEQVLAQPGCVGIKFYNAYNEAGNKTLVYVGVNAEGNDMLSISSVNANGQFELKEGIVADRIKEIKDDETAWWDFE